ncbi:MAG: carbohydrate ABC transporter permease [Oscillospiraceae bacterium]|nr:carbohydrate ABC transporter permease [Oscillospiraceae bacterium]
MSMKSMYGDNSKSYSTSKRIKSTLIFIFLVIISIICILPIYFLIINSTRDHVDISGMGVTLIPGSIEKFKANWNLLFDEEFKYTADIFLGFKNSLIITIPSTIFTIFFSCLTAYGLVVYDYKLKTPAYTFILAVMMVPATVTTTGYSQVIYKINRILIDITGKEDLMIHGNILWVILPAVAAPAIVFFMRQYMKSTFPLDLVEAGRIDGSSEFRTFFTIALPIMKPAIAVQSIFAFVSKWNDLYTPSILLSNNTKAKTLPMMISSVSNNRQQAHYASAAWLAISISVVPMIIVYIILSKFIIGGVTAGGVKE